MTLRRTIIVIAPDQVAAANKAIAAATGNPADAQTFTVPLHDANDTVIGYVCSWDFEGTCIDYDAVRKVIETATGSPKDAAATKRVGATGTLATSKVLAYDGSRVPVDSVLTHLGAKVAAEPVAEVAPVKR